MITKGEMSKHHNSFHLLIWMFPQTILDAMDDSPAQFKPTWASPGAQPRASVLMRPFISFSSLKLLT